MMSLYKFTESFEFLRNHTKLAKLTCGGRLKEKDSVLGKGNYFFQFNIVKSLASTQVRRVMLLIAFGLNFGKNTCIIACRIHRLFVMDSSCSTLSATPIDLYLKF